MGSIANHVLISLMLIVQQLLYIRFKFLVIPFMASSFSLNLDTIFLTPSNLSINPTQTKNEVFLSIEFPAYETYSSLKISIKIIYYVLFLKNSCNSSDLPVPASPSIIHILACCPFSEDVFINSFNKCISLSRATTSIRILLISSCTLTLKIAIQLPINLFILWRKYGYFIGFTFDSDFW